jgi:hypothetical protein
MGFFFKILNKEKISETLLDQLNVTLAPLLASEYRKLGKAFDLPPTEKTTDHEIVDTYREVGTAFHQASEIRNEHLTAGVKNRIVWIFLQYKEKNNEIKYREYLDNEVKHYLINGLRQEYQNELQLFN